MKMRFIPEFQGGAKAKSEQEVRKVLQNFKIERCSYLKRYFQLFNKMAPLGWAFLRQLHFLPNASELFLVLVMRPVKSAAAWTMLFFPLSRASRRRRPRPSFIHDKGM